MNGILSATAKELRERFPGLLRDEETHALSITVGRGAGRDDACRWNA
jgi:hypothetical protein